MKQGTQKETQSTKSEPWAPAQPALQNILGKTTGLLDANVGAGVYQGDRTAGLSETTQAGLGLMKDGAMAGAPTAQAGNGFVGGLIGNGGATTGTTAATERLAGLNTSVDTGGLSSATAKLSGPDNVATRTGTALAGGAYATDTAPVAGLMNGLSSGPTQTARSLQDVADGKYLNGANPFLDDVIERSSNEAASAVGQRFAASGRYGSGRFAGSVADAVGGIGTQLRYQDYENERGRQAQAASAIDAAGNARAGLAGNLLSTVAGVNQGNASTAATGAGLVQGTLRDALSGQAALTGVQTDNVNRELSRAGTLLSGAQSDRAAGLAGIASLPTVQNALLQPGQIVAGVGGAYDEAQQREIDAVREAFNDTQTAPWKPLGLASSIIQPIAASGGTSEGTRTTPTPSVFQQLLGFGLAGANVASNFWGK